MITLDNYFMTPDRRITCCLEFKPEYQVNAEVLLDRVNRLLAHYGSYPDVRSGWRPESINSKVPNAAPASRHLTGEAVDLADPLKYFAHWCLDHLDLLADCQLWMEDHLSTPTWVHLQSVAPHSGNRVFIP